MNYRPGDDGVNAGARLDDEARGRAVGEDFNPDHRARPEDADEKGYRDYSPTGPGENDAPWSANKGYLLAHDEPKGKEFA